MVSDNGTVEAAMSINDSDHYDDINDFWRREERRFEDVVIDVRRKMRELPPRYCVEPRRNSKPRWTLPRSTFSANTPTSPCR